MRDVQSRHLGRDTNNSLDKNSAELLWPCGVATRLPAPFEANVQCRRWMKLGTEKTRLASIRKTSPVHWIAHPMHILCAW